MAYGSALRQRVLQLYDEGSKTRAIAKQLRVSESWCRRVKQNRHLPPPRPPGGGHIKMDDTACHHLLQWVRQQPDATLEELRQRFASELNLTISVGTIWNTLRRMKLSLKKKSLIATERGRADVIEARDAFFAENLRDTPLRDVVVLDESYATTTFTRLRGRCERQHRLQESVPAGHWKTLTMLAAITPEGVLAASTIEAATDGDVFRTFIDQSLVPALRPGMVVVMDNLAAHKVAGVAESIAAAGCRLLYLPPYSPDLSPIENIWSKVKQLLRTAAARNEPDLGQAIDAALAQVTASDCNNCFAACGYTLHLK